ncbi:cysteine hydrolase family protein [Thiobacillus thioparus]|uniref:cysteine hydrolase family protein n=1 Tax=Thiobacillus thioparus TaxID=931 RepID=UPI00037F47D3|nr:cysteine hydrolase family protein [Thiobacillus thioparus]
MSKRAVVVIDLQNEYFPSGKLPLVGIEEAVANAARVIAAARSNGDPVIHVRHESIAPDAPFFVHGTKGVQIHSAVAPIEGEAVVLKNYPNAFLKTDLKQMLDANGVENVVVIGAMSHMCIDATCRAASDLGYKTIVVHDACATRDLEFGGQVVPAAQVHAAMMAALAFAYAKITTTDEYFAR